LLLCFFSERGEVSLESAILIAIVIILARAVLMQLALELINLVFKFMDLAVLGFGLLYEVVVLPLQDTVFLAMAFLESVKPPLQGARKSCWEANCLRHVCVGES
jgi:hypothetical protein